MDNLKSPYSHLKDSWEMSNQTVIDYHHQSTPRPTNVFSTYSTPRASSSYGSSQTYKPLPPVSSLVPAKVPPPASNFQKSTTGSQIQESQPRPSVQPFNSWASGTSSFPKYDPFLEENVDDMEISDDENSGKTEKPIVLPQPSKPSRSLQVQETPEVKSGAAFYKGLILYIPPFEQVLNTYRASPAMKMLYASFEFSFKIPVEIEAKRKENNIVDATVYFQNNVIAAGSGYGGHVEASVRALELLSETCYTIQAKEEYFIKCKLVDAETMKTLNLKKWEAVCQKYPELQEIAKEHIQKTFSLFLDNHTSTGVYEDIVCCNLTRADVNNIKRVVEFFHLTMLPCSVTTNLSKKHHPCVVSIHKYTSAQKLLDILVECGGENEKFKVYPPDTFKDFYKLHHNYWDLNLKNRKADFKSTLDDEELQALILKPYENTISDLFEKHKTLPKIKPLEKEICPRKAGDDFMKENLKIDVTNSKNVAPVERMQLLLKYMEQLQEYGSRVLTSGRPEMIKIYHNAIDNLRKDLDLCRKDIEKEQSNKNQTVVTVSKVSERIQTHSSRSPPRRRVSPRRNLRSPVKRNRPRDKSRSPRRNDRPRRSLSPRRKPRSKSPRSRSPRRNLRQPFRASPPKRARSPPRRRRSTSPKRARSPRRDSKSLVTNVLPSILKDQLRRFVENLRKFRIEIEDTPIEKRSALGERLDKYKDQLRRLHREASENPKDLENFIDEMEVCRDELLEQSEIIAGKPCPNDLPRNLTPPPWMNVNNFESIHTPISYPIPAPRPLFPPRIPPPPMFPHDSSLNYQFPF